MSQDTVKSDDLFKAFRRGAYQWIVQYRCGCSVTVSRLREQTGHCSHHGNGIQVKYKVLDPTR